MALTSKVAKALAKGAKKEDFIRKSNKELQDIAGSSSEGAARKRAAQKEMERRQYKRDDRIDTYNKEKDSFDPYAWSEDGEDYIPPSERKYPKGAKKKLDEEFRGIWKEMREAEKAEKRKGMAKGGMVKKAPAKKPAAKKPAVKKPIKKGK